MFNLIDTCTVVLIFAVNIRAVQNQNDGLFNVGTVLFTTNDLYKKRWSRMNIEVLQARKHFQSIIPLPSMETLNENYVNFVLTYFNNAFATLKREAADPSAAEVMEKALSDVVGGFFKVWVLPITKLYYYGGVVSQDNALKVFKFYEQLKRTLNTDGSNWRKSRKIVFNTIAISMVPFSHTPTTRSMKLPCEHLAYFEKSDAGLTIPIPIINWKDPPYSMFLPLKNESLIQLDSPSASKLLLKYYDVAESCCQSKSPDDCSKFELRFQDWVSNNVLPHINDDKLYIAFGSLLTLLNQTNEYIGKASSYCENECDKFTSTSNSLLSRLPPYMTSNKFLVLTLILILQIIWCIPALIYMICAKKKCRIKQRTKLLLGSSKRYGYYTVGRIDKSEEKNSFIDKKDVNNLNQRCQSRIIDHPVKLDQNPQERNRGVVTQYSKENFTRSVGQVTSMLPNIHNEQKRQSESVILVNEKITVDTSRSSHATLTGLLKCKDTQVINTKQTKSFTKFRKLETTITKIIKGKSVNNSKPCVTCPSNKESIEKIESELKRKLQEVQVNDEINDIICPCLGCIEQDQKDIRANTVAALKGPRSVNVKNNSGVATRPRNIRCKTKVPKLQPKLYAPKTTKTNQTEDLNLNNGEPLLEIKIDRPVTEITVDITNTRRKNVKPSKIPRLAATGHVKDDCTLESTLTNAKPCTCIKKAPKTSKKRSMDDSNVKRPMVKRNKLNVTL